MTYHTITTEVDVYLDEFTDQELLDELHSRGLDSLNQLLSKIHELRRTGRDYQHLLDELIWQTLGRIS